MDARCAVYVEVEHRLVSVSMAILAQANSGLVPALWFNGVHCTGLSGWGGALGIAVAGSEPATLEAESTR